MLLIFEDRCDAGRMLAHELAAYAGREDVIVLGLPRGGVPVAYEIATALDAPLDIFVVRKLGVPGYRELALGAIASGGIRILNDSVIEGLGLSTSLVEEVTEREVAELKRREYRYRGDRSLPDLRAKTVILVDDGIATGATMRAAVTAVRRHEPAAVIVAVPVAAPETCRALSNEADEIVALLTPTPFRAIGLWYRDFSQTSDREVCELLERAASRNVPATAPAPLARLPAD